MAAIGKTVKLSWDGREYETQVTMRLINRIEEDVNLLKLAMSLAQGDVPTSHVATVFSHLLKAAGAEASAEDVWSAMFGDSATDVITAATLALECVFPVVKAPKVGGESVGKQKSTRGVKSTK